MFYPKSTIKNSDWTDSVHPKVHEFLSQNTRLCTRRVTDQIFYTPKCIHFGPKNTHVNTKTVSLRISENSKLHEFGPQNIHLCTHS